VAECGIPSRVTILKQRNALGAGGSGRRVLIGLLAMIKCSVATLEGGQSIATREWKGGGQGGASKTYKSYGGELAARGLCLEM